MHRLALRFGYELERSHTYYDTCTFMSDGIARLQYVPLYVPLIACDGTHMPTS